MSVDTLGQGVYFKGYNNRRAFSNSKNQVFIDRISKRENTRIDAVAKAVEMFERGDADVIQFCIDNDLPHLAAKYGKAVK